MSMQVNPIQTGGKAPARNLIKTAVLAAALTAVAAAQAMAHTLPWRAGMSRMTGFGHCAKGPCLRRYDLSPSVPHVHVRVKGRMAAVVCNGLQPDRGCRNQ